MPVGRRRENINILLLLLFYLFLLLLLLLVVRHGKNNVKRAIPVTGHRGM
jgi:hypothetical protein